MTRHIQVLVVEKDGRPAIHKRVSIQIHAFLAGGFLPPEFTNTSGIAHFQFDTDASAEITIFVGGNVEVKRGSIRSSYKVFL